MKNALAADAVLIGSGEAWLSELSTSSTTTSWC